MGGFETVGFCVESHFSQTDMETREERQSDAKSNKMCVQLTSKHKKRESRMHWQLKSTTTHPLDFYINGPEQFEYSIVGEPLQVFSDQF